MMNKKSVEKNNNARSADGATVTGTAAGNRSDRTRDGRRTRTAKNNISPTDSVRPFIFIIIFFLLSSCRPDTPPMGDRGAWRAAIGPRRSVSANGFRFSSVRARSWGRRRGGKGAETGSAKRVPTAAPAPMATDRFARRPSHPDVHLCPLHGFSSAKSSVYKRGPGHRPSTVRSAHPPEHQQPQVARSTQLSVKKPQHTRQHEGKRVRVKRTRFVSATTTTPGRHLHDRRPRGPPAAMSIFFFLTRSRVSPLQVLCIALFLVAAALAENKEQPQKRYASYGVSGSPALAGNLLFSIFLHRVSPSGNITNTDYYCYYY